MIAFFEGFIKLIGGMGEAFFNGSSYVEIFGVLSLGVIVILIVKNLIL